MTTPSVVLSYGLGVDSTAILLRWISDPSSRDFDLSELMVITAMTGDEWTQTGELVTDHVLPLMRAHGIRYVQVARATGSQSDGVAVLDDSTSPTTLHLRGAYRLSDEMFTAGTIPQRGGSRLCSSKSKGWALDKFILDATGGRPFRHVIGFEANEMSRARKDCTYDTDIRGGEYPLIQWGWDRQTCIDYIRSVLGVTWAKSACTFCPFALENKESRRITLQRFHDAPADGVQALLLEHTALALNPAQTLSSAGPLHHLVSDEVAQEFWTHLWRQPHAIYEVRRVLRPRKDDRTRLANASRSVRMMVGGDRRQMQSLLHHEALSRGLTVTRDPVASLDPLFARLWLRRRPQVFPGVEHMFTVAPRLVADKQHPRFEDWWDTYTDMDEEGVA